MFNVDKFENDLFELRNLVLDSMKQDVSKCAKLFNMSRQYIHKAIKCEHQIKVDTLIEYYRLLQENK